MISRYDFPCTYNLLVDLTLSNVSTLNYDICLKVTIWWPSGSQGVLSLQNDENILIGIKEGTRRLDQFRNLINWFLGSTLNLDINNFKKFWHLKIVKK